MYGENSGRHLYDMARGVDKRRVEPPGRAKSVARERTFDHDMKCCEVLEQELLLLADQVGSRLREKGLKGRTVSIKVKYADFQTLTRSFTLPQATSHGPDIYYLARRLFDNLEKTKAIRLLGVIVSHFGSEEEDQPSLFHDAQKSRLCRLDEGIDKIRGKYGDQSIVPGSLLTGRGKSPKHR